jgi:hypothetical protein
MEATYSSGTSVDFQRTTWRYISEDITFHNQRCENLKSYLDLILPYKFKCRLQIPHLIWIYAAVSEMKIADWLAEQPRLYSLYQHHLQYDAQKIRRYVWNQSAQEIISTHVGSS